MQISKNTIISEIQRVAHEMGVNQLTRSNFSAETGISSWHIYQLFDGWRDACEQAGLKPHFQNIPIEDDDLFEELRRIFLDCSGICTRTKFGKLSQYSVDTYKKRFGTWQEILVAFRSWLENNQIAFPFIDNLPLDQSLHIRTNEESTGQAASGAHQWQSLGGTTYGPFLNFRGLQHAPLNELGVVFLFGMVCNELGFVVEALRSEYPDCEAKRRIDKSGNKWEKVRIEFEFRSSSFKVHGHKPELCDVIVCWEHDWAECPLEIIELKSVIESLNG
jgi:hypothetical protein